MLNSKRLKMHIPKFSRGWVGSCLFSLAVIMASTLFLPSDGWSPCYTFIGDYVWNDANQDGLQDANESGIPNVKVILRGSGGGELEHVFTNDNGYYEFTRHCPDDYIVEVDKSTVHIEGYADVEPSSPCSDDFVSRPDNESDSNCSPQTLTLGDNEQNDTIDFGYYGMNYDKSALGDRVWQDLNGNGAQDCNDTNANGIIGDAGDTGLECDAGIGNVTVQLVNCQTPANVLETTYTDAEGFYLFENLDGGDYCVQFDLDSVPADVCEFGAPVFTRQNVGGGDKDSNADPDTGVTSVIHLGTGQVDLTVDTGILCPGPASLGDRVWEDLNGDDVQNCVDTNGNGIIGDAGDTDPECNAGIGNVTVQLVNCQTPANLLETTYTDAEGFYLFENLDGGDYCVQFDLDSVPADVCEFGAPVFTGQNVGDDALDSDADRDTGISSPVDLVTGETNRTVDAGIVCQECAITIDKKCVVVAPPTESFDCDGKVDALKMIWNDPGTTLQSVKALPGGSESFPTVSITDEGGLQVVTVTGYQPSTNDVIWNWVSESGSGESIFHLSCSDNEMNGSEDCGMPEGNGKSNEAAYDNVWLLDGLTTDKGFVLDCTPQPAEAQDECAFEASPPPDCESEGRPYSLTFVVTGDSCDDSVNDQGDNFECTDYMPIDPMQTIEISMLKDADKIDVTPDSVNVDELVTIARNDDSDFASDTILVIRQDEAVVQYLNFHTSCSQPLAAGDSFGSLELVQFNGQSAGAEVTYSYEVTNIGANDVDVTSVSDNKLGELLPDTDIPKPVSPGASFTLYTTAFIDTTITNEVTATANILGTEELCGTAKDTVKVEVTKPTCDMKIVLDSLDDDKIKWKLTNSGKIVATLETLTVNFPPEYGFIKEVKLDGGIFKKGDSSVYPAGVPSGATIVADDWTEADVSKRQLDPGETRTLEVVFTEKSKGEGWVEIDSEGTATFAESCEVELVTPSACELGKPTALVFQYTGEECVDGNDQADDKWSCSSDPDGAEPVEVVMTKDADKFSVDPGTMYLDGIFEIRMKEVGKEFPSEIKFDIRQGGQTLQSLVMHTSCSQPLQVGDQFGSVILMEFYPKF